jgi:hypothetical protein
MNANTAVLRSRLSMNPVESVVRLIAGEPRLRLRRGVPALSSSLKTLPDPETGRPLAVADVDVSDRAVCPRCTSSGKGAYVSFVSDLRLAFACPRCLQVTWISGA